MIPICRYFLLQSCLCPELVEVFFFLIFSFLFLVFFFFFSYFFWTTSLCDRTSELRKSSELQIRKTILGDMLYDCVWLPESRESDRVLLLKDCFPQKMNIHPGVNNRGFVIVMTEGTDVLADSKKVVRKCRPMCSKGRPQGDAYDKGDMGNPWRGWGSPWNLHITPIIGILRVLFWKT